MANYNVLQGRLGSWIFLTQTVGLDVLRQFLSLDAGL